MPIIPWLVVLVFALQLPFYSHRTPILNRSLPLPGEVTCGFETNSVCPTLEADGSIRVQFFAIGCFTWPAGIVHVTGISTYINNEQKVFGWSFKKGIS
jgi:hypothetical protein